MIVALKVKMKSGILMVQLIRIVMEIMNLLKVKSSQMIVQVLRNERKEEVVMTMIHF